MLKPDYFYGKEDRMIHLFNQLSNFIMQDIARRIIESGQLPPTADRLVWKMKQMGAHRDEILKKLSTLTKLQNAELKELLQDAVLTSWKDDADSWSEIGVTLSDPLENKAVIAVMDAEFKKSAGELANLTRTTMEQSQQDLINLLDKVETQVSSGVQSYNAAVIQALEEYAGKGIMVEYPSGARLTLEAAVRLCVVTSMNQTAAQVSNQYVLETGTNYVVTSAHYGARVKRDGQPDLAGHDLWQGRIFCISGSEEGYPNLLESTGYTIDKETGAGTVVNPLGLHGYNCRHSHKPWDIGMRNPWRDENGNLLDGNGNILTDKKNEQVYHDRGRQREMERSIRATKRKIVMKRTEIDAIAETDVKDMLEKDLEKLNKRLSDQNRAYNEYCKQKNLQPDYVRTQLADYDRKRRRKART